TTLEDLRNFLNNTCIPQIGICELQLPIKRSRRSTTSASRCIYDPYIGTCEMQ
ncbi:hypothetical protein HAX54_048515, partial [Datura stramonium]|nr:hypothetical protein [Datura stramonium]